MISEDDEIVGLDEGTSCGWRARCALGFPAAVTIGGCGWPDSREIAAISIAPGKLALRSVSVRSGRRRAGMSVLGSVWITGRRPESLSRRRLCGSVVLLP